MSNLYMELDAAVDRVILLSQWHGNLSEYGKNPDDREWLRNELEQICHLPCDVGPLPKWNFTKPKESGWYLVTAVSLNNPDDRVVGDLYYRKSTETWDDIRGGFAITAWMHMPKPCTYNNSRGVIGYETSI